EGGSQQPSAPNFYHEGTVTKSAAIHIRVAPAIKKAAEKAAEADRRSVASLVEKILVEHLVEAGYLKPAAAE
ncbi:MAG TPA: hypothetical protein VMA86_03900, partial [Acetobacteraceae bacterium]|nr:hypothetical protein [Acetobacteraceae bacterium]